MNETSQALDEITDGRPAMRQFSSHVTALEDGEKGLPDLFGFPLETEGLVEKHRDAADHGIGIGDVPAGYVGSRTVGRFNVDFLGADAG